MKLRFGALKATDSTDLSAADLADYRKLVSNATRVGAYAMLAALGIWTWLGATSLGLDQVLAIQKPQRFLVLAALVCICLFVVMLGHEICHLIAIPTRIFHRDTTIGFWVAKPAWKSTFYVQVGGRLTRLQFIWLSLFPFLILTVLPFLWLISGRDPPSLLIGTIAACNLYGSAVDIAQAWVIAKEGKLQDILRQA